MKKIILLLLFIVSIAKSIYGQTKYQDITEEVNDLINYQTLGTNNQSTVNIAHLNQVGNNNTITVFQQNKGNVANQLFSLQTGTSNVAYINETGYGHTALLLQNGDNNKANLWTEGNLNFTKIQQIGKSNLVNSYIVNSNPVPQVSLLQQTGDNNRIDFEILTNGTRNEARPVTACIKQTGNNLSVNAVLDSHQYPVYIEQQAGAKGGMNVNISISDFSFPMKNYK